MVQQNGRLPSNGKLTRIGLPKIRWPLFEFPHLRMWGTVEGWNAGRGHRKELALFLWAEVMLVVVGATRLPNWDVSKQPELSEVPADQVS